MKAIPHFFQRSTASVKYHAAHNEESEQMLPQGAQDTTTPALKTRAGQHTSWIMALVLTVVNIGLLGHSISHPMDKDGVCSSYISQFGTIKPTTSNATVADKTTSRFPHSRPRSHKVFHKNIFRVTSQTLGIYTTRPRKGRSSLEQLGSRLYGD